MDRVWQSSPVRFVREMVGLYFGKRVSRASAELAYWMILSFFPLLICVNAFVGVLQMDPGSVIRTLRPFLPPSLLGVVAEYLAYVTRMESSTLLAVGGFSTILFASAAVRGLMNIMNEIYDRKGYPGVVQVLVSVLFSLLLLVVVYLSMVVVLTGTWFFHMVERYLPIQWLPGTWNWQWIKYLLLFGVVFLLVVVIYLMVSPPGKPRAPVFLGSLLASAALVGASAIFSAFISMSSRYSLIYGSLASVIILLLWLYLCGNILIVGSIFNCVRYKRRLEREKQKNPEKTS